MKSRYLEIYSIVSVDDTMQNEKQYSFAIIDLSFNGMIKMYPRIDFALHAESSI